MLLKKWPNFFRVMQGDANNQIYLNEYFMTHPLYTNRINTLKIKLGDKNQTYN